MLGLVVVDEVVATVVIHIDHIQIGASQEVAGAVIHFLSDKQSINSLGELSWYMVSEFKRDRDEGSLEISQTRLVQNDLDRFNVTKPARWLPPWILDP